MFRVLANNFARYIDQAGSPTYYLLFYSHESKKEILGVTVRIAKAYGRFRRCAKSVVLVQWGNFRRTTQLQTDESRINILVESIPLGGIRSSGD